MGISLDISNAFNTLPWDCIMVALEYHGMPRYLQMLIRDYFRERKVQYTGRGTVSHQRIRSSTGIGPRTTPVEPRL